MSKSLVNESEFRVCFQIRKILDNQAFLTHFPSHLLFPEAKTNPLKYTIKYMGVVRAIVEPMNAKQMEKL